MPIPSLSTTSKLFIRLGAISGALAVTLGAIGAHKLKKEYTKLPKEKALHLSEMFDKANKYHFINSSMLIVGSVISKYPIVPGGLFISSILLFSGPLYYQAFTTEYSDFNKLAPFGGTCAILGWLSLVLI